MKNALVAITALGLASFALHAGAETTNATSFYESLPQGSLGVPTQLLLPDSIPADEHAEGVFAEIPEYMKNNPNPSSRYAQVFGSKQDAAAYQAGEGEHASACLVASSASSSMGGQIRWNGNFSASATVSPYSRSYTYGPDGATPKDLVTVGAVRVDRVKPGATDDELSLDTRIVLVDAATLGSRLLSTTTTEFKLVRTLPGQVKVYGAREADTVTYLIRHEPLEGERSSGSMFGQLANFESVSASDNCAMTFSLPVRQDSASTMLVQLEAVLEIRSAEVEDFHFGESDPPPSFATDQPREARMRPMQIGFSSSWMSQDTTPVLSISHGWTGKERIQPM
jgi:hypothetical protein